jgi:hypothetical protein
MRSQIVTASPGNAVADASKRSIRHLPYAFTEHSALMAANILNSPRAVATSIYVIRYSAFCTLPSSFPCAAPATAQTRNRLPREGRQCALPGEEEVTMPNEFQFDVWPCAPPSFSGSWAGSRQHNCNRLMLVLSAGWSFRDSVAAPSERLLDAARAELFSVSPERACGLSPSRCRHDILMDRPLHGCVGNSLTARTSG